MLPSPHNHSVDLSDDRACDGEDSILLPAMGFVGVSMVIRCTFKLLRMAARGRKLKKDGLAEMPKNPLK